MLLEYSACAYTKLGKVILKKVFSKFTNTSPFSQQFYLRFLASMKKLPFLIVLDLA